MEQVWYTKGNMKYCDGAEHLLDTIIDVYK